MQMTISVKQWVCLRADHTHDLGPPYNFFLVEFRPFFPSEKASEEIIDPRTLLPYVFFEGVQGVGLPLGFTPFWKIIPWQFLAGLHPFLSFPRCKFKPGCQMSDVKIFLGPSCLTPLRPAGGHRQNGLTSVRSKRALRNFCPAPFSWQFCLAFSVFSSGNPV
jgi:hypothetical protein